MMSRLLLFLPLLLYFVVGGTHASAAGQVYWHAVLPKTPFPKALQHLFQPNLGPSKGLSETTNDATSIYGKPRNPKKMNLLHEYLPSSEGFSKITKDASIAYEKTRISERTQLPDDVALSKDLLKFLKDLYNVKSKTSQKSTLQYDDSAPSKSMSETVKDLSTIYEKPRNSKKMSLLHEETKNSEQILHDDLASFEYLLKFLKELAAYLYGKSKNSQQIDNQVQYDDSVPSQDMADTVKDLSIIYETPRKGSKTNKDIDLPEAKQHAIEDRTIFYMYNDLQPGKKMTLLFTNAGNKVDFLPRQVAETIPFSTDKLPEILNRFSIDPDSADAEVIKDTIGDCESRQREEVYKHCATSLESLVDQNVARLGRNIRLLSTPEGKKQEHTVLAGIKKIADDRVIVCHRERYPYAVYYCHEINDTEVYTVPLMGADGTKLKAVTVCHKDTSAWNPDYIAFQILKTRPGQPFCHFLSSDALVWFQTNELEHDTRAYLQNIINHGVFDI